MRDFEYPAYSLALSSDGRWLATCGFKEVIIWDVDIGDVKQILEGYFYLILSLASSLAWSYGGKFASSCDETVHIWDVATDKMVQQLKDHNGVVGDWQL